MKERPLLLFICGLLQACSQNSLSVAKSDEPGPAITPGGTPSRYTTEQEAQAAALVALRGDGRAALDLFLYFTGDRFDADKANYWLKVAKDNGEPNALYEFGSRSAASSNPCKVMRGIYFLERAFNASPGDKDAKYLAAEIQDAKERLRTLPAADCLRADTTLEPMKEPFPTGHELTPP